MNPQFPLYIVSKKRYDTRYTSRFLESINVPYHIIIEEQEADLYAQYISREKILILDKRYQDEYETHDDLGYSKSKGPGAARNFAWDHSIKNGFSWHWVMDDNIRDFRRFHKNEKVKVSDGSIFKAMEDFVLRYKNIGMAGPNYYMFCPARQKQPPFILNTRIYSCNLIKNDLPFRWSGRYNEDTHLSLKILKSGLCTVQFNAFLQNKLMTQTIRGGNNEDFYKKEGTLAKSKMQVDLHPDISRLVWRFNRWHHYVDYKVFKQTLIRDENKFKDIIPVNNYGMELKVKNS